MKTFRLAVFLLLAALLSLACRLLVPAGETLLPTPAPETRSVVSPTAPLPTESLPVTVQRQTTTYAISGQSAETLRQQMNLLGPVNSQDGKIYDARTNWQIGWRFSYQTTPQGCALQSAQVQVDLTFIFPAWQDAASAPPDLQQKWQTYFQALTTHEEHHAELAAQSGAEIYRALLSVAPAADCPTLEETANAAAHQAFEAGESLQAQYDQETGHGATQGAVFP